MQPAVNIFVSESTQVIFANGGNLQEVILILGEPMDDNNNGNSKAAGLYELFMLGLCVYVLAALAAMTFFRLDPAVGTGVGVCRYWDLCRPSWLISASSLSLLRARWST
jgi:hypothetical protein